MLGAVAGALLITLGIGLTRAHQATVELIGLIPASVLVVGKFLPLLGIGASRFSAWELGLVIWALDTFTVLVIVYGLQGLYRIRPLARTLARVQTSAGLVLAAYPRMRRTAVAGVVLFVLFPLAGTGALVGTFLGILLGLHRGVLIAAVSFGGLTGGMIMAFAAVNFRDAVIALRNVQSDPVIKWLIVGAVVVALIALFVWVNRMYKRALEAARKDLQEGGAV